jgi:hypothetical protein
MLSVVVGRRPSCHFYFGCPWAVTQGAVFIVPVRSHPSSSLSLGHCPGSCLSVGHWTRRRSVGGTLPKKTFLCGPLRCCCGLSSLSLLVLGIVVGRHPSRHLLSFYCSLFPFFCHDSIHASPTTRRIHPTTAPPLPVCRPSFPCSTTLDSADRYPPSHLPPRFYVSTGLWFPQFVLRGSTYLYRFPICGTILPLTRPTLPFIFIVPF